jgi:CAAX prenyl protease-like protein
VTETEPTSRKKLPEWIPFAAPFLVFAVFTWVESLDSLADLYVWLYAAKTIAVAGLCVVFRRAYPPFARRGLGWGALAGVAGVVLWVGVAQIKLEERWFGQFVQMSSRVGFNPFAEIESPALRWLFIAVRFAGLALVVPLMEEVFWRGFLGRYLIDEDFTAVPIGRWTPLSFAVVTFAFAAVHPEFIAALLWGAGVNLLLSATRNLWSCVVAHAVTNLLLGMYVIRTEAWGLW